MFFRIYHFNGQARVLLIINQISIFATTSFFSGLWNGQKVLLQQQIHAVRSFYY